MVLKEEFVVTDGELAEFVRQQTLAYEQESPPPPIRTHIEARLYPNVDKHQRHDTLPDPRSGRRALGIKDEKVRIYLQFPTTGDTISLRVHPELRLGPREGTPEAEEEKAQEITRRKTLVGTSGQIARLKAKLWPQKKSIAGAKAAPQKGQAFTDLNSVQQRPSTSVNNNKYALSSSTKEKRVMPSTILRGDNMDMRPPLEEEGSLKEQIYRLTGLLPSEQRLFYNRCRLTIHDSNLRDYGIGHGDTLLCMQPLQCSPVYHGVKTRNKINLREMVPLNSPLKGFRFMPRWKNNQHPRLFEADAGSVTNTGADAIFVFDYSAIPDHGHTDFTAKIRRMHGIT